MVSPEITDRMGDEELSSHVASSEPEFVGLSLYLWNTERSLHLAKEIKKKSPKTKILIGGPEVNHDNPFILKETGYDIAVSGEAEHSFRKLMTALVEKSPLTDIENIAYRKESGEMGNFSQELSANFPLTDFPSPYTTGFLSVDPKRSTYLETVRGCKSQCTYCFYPKSSQNLRTLNIEETIKLISSLKEQGAKELVFLDPTFNHRPGFEAFLDAIAEVNSDGQMSMFAELRSEGVTPKLAGKLKKAGFNRIELGMQSVNKETLKRVKRYGDPEKVAEVAKILAGEGIDLLLDLIIGLPGDTPDDVERGIHFFLEHGLGEWVQAFPLSVLPGTAMRKDAEKEGLEYLMTPPYRVIRTPNFTEDQLKESLFLAEDLLDRRLDEFPRSFLCEAIPGGNDRIDLDLDRKSASENKSLVKTPLSRHHSVWFHSEDFETKSDLISDLMRNRLETDPYCTIDFVFKTGQPLSDVFLQRIFKTMTSLPASYLSRALAHREENMQHRMVVLLSNGSSIRKDWVRKHGNNSAFLLYQEQSMKEALSHAEDLGIELPFAYIIGKDFDSKDWNDLKEKADPEAVSFSSRERERQWSLEVLGYGEV